MNTLSTPSFSICRHADADFVRLITNPSDIPSEPCEPADPALQGIRSYIQLVLKGDGDRPYCPIVPFIEKQNGYYVRLDPNQPETVDFPRVLQEMRDCFFRLSPADTTAGQELDVTTVMTGFSHPEAMHHGFCDTLKSVHETEKFSFIERGLMLAYMHPSHPLGSASGKRADPGNEPLYLSAIPLFMVRRMIPADDRFMRNEAEIMAYQRYFPRVP